MKINLCKRGRCCATVEKNGNMFIMEDDYGGYVELTREETQKLVKEIDKLW